MPKQRDYSGNPGEIYEFLKKEYQKRRGIAFTVGGVHTDKLKPEEAEKKRKEEVDRRAGVLVDFWKQYFVKHQTKPGTATKAEDIMRKTEEMKKTETSMFREKIATYSEEDIKYTLSQDIEKEINQAMAHAEKAKVASKVLEEHGKIEEEKRMFQKALNIQYSFERENMAE